MDKSGFDESVVGLEDEVELIKEKLTRGTKALDFVPIVGMGGIGKTTMAKKVYQQLEYYFHIRAFCCVSQMYDKIKFLLELLAQIAPLPNKFEQMSFQDLGEMLYRGLKGRRYLVVMDDLWDIGAWNDLGIFFPNENNGSRVLFTSREKNVVMKVKPDILPHCLRMLSEEETWELLEKKAFHEGCCPPELLGAGRNIARMCQRLPLAVVVVAGLLSKTEHDKWEQIAESVSANAKIECGHVFELSYKHLPEHLKPCFLYLAAFEEDFLIPARKLVQLWVSEGFIPTIVQQHKCLEDLAEDYLVELIDRNLVMVSERSSLGGSKVCHLHDMMLEFCWEKAREEKFMQRIQGLNWIYAFESLHASVHRLCCSYRGQVGNVSSFLFNPSLRSLIFFRTTKMSYQDDYSFISSLKHLTVLDLWNSKITQNFFNMDLPIHLRFLAVCGIIEYIPSSLSKLSKLETFIVYTHMRRPIDLPTSIWEMALLRHLQLHGSFFRLPEPKWKLENLQTLAFVSSGGDETNEILNALPGLRRIKIFVSKPLFEPLKFVSELQSLHLHFPPECMHSSFSECLPAHLKKLSLFGIVFFGPEISLIGNLPNLEVLKLLHGNFLTNKWCLGEEKFPKLKFLKITESDIEKWDASSDHFPLLEKLVLDRCYVLESIPSSFGELPSLQFIDVQWCCKSTSISARHIKDVQMEMGNEDLKVHIYPKYEIFFR